jgi:CheY-like chemotaxis protein
MENIFILIDDEPIFNIITTKMIRNELPDAEIMAFANAIDALRFLEQAHDRLEGKQAVIFVDLNMPVMTGFEFLDEFQKKFGNSPAMTVNVLSSSIDDRDRQKAFAFPCTANYYSKPFNTQYIR